MWRPRLLSRPRRAVSDWWLFDDIRGYDPDYAAAGDKSFIIVSIERRFKRCLVIEVDRDDLVLLAEMIQDGEIDD